MIQTVDGRNIDKSLIITC